MPFGRLSHCFERIFGQLYVFTFFSGGSQKQGEGATRIRDPGIKIPPDRAALGHHARSPEGNLKLDPPSTGFPWAAHRLK